MLSLNLKLQLTKPIAPLPPEFRHEVAEARWLPLDEAPDLLAYGGEKDMARKARTVLESYDDV